MTPNHGSSINRKGCRKERDDEESKQRCLNSYNKDAPYAQKVRGKQDHDEETNGRYTEQTTGNPQICKLQDQNGKSHKMIFIADKILQKKCLVNMKT